MVRFPCTLVVSLLFSSSLLVCSRRTKASAGDLEEGEFSKGQTSFTSWLRTMSAKVQSSSAQKGLMDGKLKEKSCKAAQAWLRDQTGDNGVDCIVEVEKKRCACGYKRRQTEEASKKIKEWSEKASGGQFGQLDKATLQQLASSAPGYNEWRTKNPEKGLDKFVGNAFQLLISKKHPRGKKAHTEKMQAACKSIQPNEDSNFEKIMDRVTQQYVSKKPGYKEWQAKHPKEKAEEFLDESQQMTIMLEMIPMMKKAYLADGYVKAKTALLSKVSPKFKSVSVFLDDCHFQEEYAETWMA